MDTTLSEQRFEEFGPNPLDPFPSRPTQRVVARTTDQLRQEVRNSCPKSPGIYGMLDREGHLIYVGKSKSLRTRLLSYFSPRNAEEKAGSIIVASRQIIWEFQPSEFAALVREQQLIRRWTPRWNVQEIPRRQRPVYLCLGRRPAPYFFLAAMPPADIVASEGPFLGAGRMSRAVDSLNNFFGLRDCSNKQRLFFSDQMQLFDLEHRPGCLRLEIGTCSGACVGACTQGQYDDQVKSAQSFLDGFNGEPVDTLRQRIESAAAEKQYELASRMLLNFRSLDYLYRKLLFLADARRRYTFIYAPGGDREQRVWYLIRQGELVEAIAAPRNPDEYATARRKLRPWREAITDPGNHASASPFPYTLSLVAAWLRKNPDQIQQTFQPAEAGRRYRRLAKA